LSIIQTSEDYNFSYRKFPSLKQWIINVIRAEQFQPGDIAMVFCSDKYLLTVNQNYLSHDYYTDIITFDYSEGIILSGDLLISIDRVKENARLYSVEFSNELDRVILHGILHLMGYNDDNTDNLKAMREREDHYLNERSKIS
jgi:probable rRNA maturation factor